MRKLPFSSFQVIRHLGDGSSSIVRECKLRCPEEHGYPTYFPSIALKLILKNKVDPDSILTDEDGVSLPMEIYLLRDLNETPSPHIIEMLNGWEDGQFYYVMMPLHGDGMDLFTFIERESPLDGRRILMIFSQILMAVNHLHNIMNVVHRDLKDENIIIDQRDQIKLVDFGSSAFYKDKETIFTSFKGTLNYASPEHLLKEPLNYGGKEQDIWALGIILYVLKYSKFPFKDDDKERCILQIPPPIIDSNTTNEQKKITLYINDLIRAFLNPLPEKRPSISEVIKDPIILKYYNKDF